MIRLITRWCVLGLVASAAASPAFAQLPNRARLQAVPTVSSVPQGEIRGIVEDDTGQPLAGVVVSAVGATALFATTDAKGKFVFRNLSLGPYLVRAHLQGYVPAKAQVIQVGAGQATVHTLSLTRTAAPIEPSKVLTAGVGGTDGS